jgi:hypothetical protein
MKNKGIIFSLLSIGVLLAILGSTLESMVGFFIAGLGVSYILKQITKKD